jgi:catechol 2,3-dioxygenase-like lactoylglutathione lyase family enzyme
LIAAQLPLKTTGGIEHLSLWVDDVQAVGEFFGKVFNPALHKEKDPPLRYYVLLSPDDRKGPLSYMAIGDARGRPVQIDHYCVLVQDYNSAAMNERMKQEGAKVAPGFGVYLDGDGLQLQMLAPPAGLAATTVPAGRISEDAPIVEPLGVENVILQVSDLGKSTAYYRKLFKGRTLRDGDRVWIEVGDSRLGLEQVAAGGKPVISSFCVKVKPFDRGRVAVRLEALGAKVVAPRKGEGGALRFTSPMGLQVELKGVKA